MKIIIKTLSKPVLIDVGLHTGKKSNMSIFPAHNNHGIVLKEQT